MFGRYFPLFMKYIPQPKIPPRKMNRNRFPLVKNGSSAGLSHFSVDVMVIIVAGSVVVVVFVAGSVVLSAGALGSVGRLMLIIIYSDHGPNASEESTARTFMV